MCSRILILLLISTFHDGNANEKHTSKISMFEEAEESSRIDESLVECVVHLTQITIIFSPTILVLESKSDEKDDVFSNKIIEKFAENSVPITIQDKDNHEINQTLDVYDGNVIVIIYFENCDLLFNFNLEQVDNRVKYLVIIFEVCEDYVLKLQSFSQQFTERDITFIIHDLVARRHDVITFLRIMDERKCEFVDKMNPKYINVCINGSLQTNVVFPEEIKINFKNCSLTVGMATMFPFSTIPNEEKLKNYDLIHEIFGSDVEIIKIIGNYFNASLVWRYLHREPQNPFTNTEYVIFFTNGSVDIAAGGLYRIYGDLVSYSGIYTMQAVIWIYTAHRTGRSWVNLVHKLNGIYFFDLFYLLYSFSSYCFRKYDCEHFSLRDILLYSWGALIGASSLLKPKSFKHKFLDTSYLLLSIYLVSYMNIQLVSFLTVDGPSISFKTNYDVINSGRTLYLNEKNKKFIQEGSYLAYANTSKECGGFFDCSNKVLYNDGLTAILDAYFYPVQAITAVKDEARLLRATQNILTVYQEMVISKDNLILKGFQKCIERLFEAGICSKLYKEAIGITVVTKANIANKVALSNSYSCVSGCAITLPQVAGVFYFWGFGCFIAISVFSLEIMWNKQTQSD